MIREKISGKLPVIVIDMTLLGVSRTTADMIGWSPCAKEVDWIDLVDWDDWVESDAGYQMLKVNNNENKERKVLRLITIFDRKIRFL